MKGFYASQFSADRARRGGRWRGMVEGKKGKVRRLEDPDLYGRTQHTKAGQASASPTHL